MSRALLADRQGTWLLVGCALVLALAIAGAAADETWQRHAEADLQRVRPDAGGTAILFDATDPLSRAQAAVVQERLRTLETEEIHTGSLVSVWRLGGTPDGPLQRELLLHCPPRQANPIYENPQHAAARFDSLLARPLRRVVAGLPTGTPARWSPIMEALSVVGEAPELRDGVGRHQLILVSDLQQHTPDVSFCSRTPRYDAFRRSRAFERLQLDLRGVAVEVWLVPRAQHDLDAELALRRFWCAYLEAAGAKSVRIERL
jgi:hypothetical protein